MKQWNWQKKIFLKSIFFLFLVFNHASAEIIFAGYVKVSDGDTTKISKYKIRLHGIDAPEIKQICRDKHDSPYMCGIVAKNFLIDLIRRRGVNEQKKVYCYYSERDRYKRIIGKCYVGKDSKFNLNHPNELNYLYQYSYLSFSPRYISPHQA